MTARTAPPGEPSAAVSFDELGDVEQAVARLAVGMEAAGKHHAPGPETELLRRLQWPFEVVHPAGDVAGRDCILFDDIIDSGGTLCNAADVLMEMGAKSVLAYCTHGVLSGGAVARIMASKLKELVITDSIQPTQAVTDAHNIRVLPISDLIGEAISRTATEESVSSLFD